jgi:hypothetical protein
MMDVNYRHDLWIDQANVYMDMGDDKLQLKATILFERVIHKNPLYGHARLNLSYCLRQRGYYQRTWVQFAAPLHLNLKHGHAFETRAIVCLQMNHLT